MPHWTQVYIDLAVANVYINIRAQVTLSSRNTEFTTVHTACCCTLLYTFLKGVHNDILIATHIKLSFTYTKDTVTLDNVQSTLQQYI